MSRPGAHPSAALWRSTLAVLLGLSGRRSPGAERTRRSSATSSYEAPVDGADVLQLGRAYWLPPFGRGNGLDALFWTSVARVPEARADAALDALRDEDIPAWAAAVRDRGSGRAAAAPLHDLWVASAQLDTAQDVLLRVLAD